MLMDLSSDQCRDGTLALKFFKFKLRSNLDHDAEDGIPSNTFYLSSAQTLPKNNKKNERKDLPKDSTCAAHIRYLKYLSSKLRVPDQGV